MTQQRLTESPEKTQQHVESRETSPAFAQLFHGGLHPIAQLQRRLGNRRVAQLIQAKRLTPEGKIIGLQRKLTVGAADDQYEQEADRVARHVLNTSDAVAANSIQRAMSPEEDKDQTLQTKPLAASITPFVQRQMGNNEESEDNEKSVQARFFTETSRDPLQRQPETEEEETEPIQAKSARPLADSFEAGAEVETQVSLSKGRGSPLPNPVRAYMEPRFGADFSQVRVHTGSDALQMNHAVGAQAFTHGSDIYFGAGKSPTDLSLTAHELTHVVQQGRAGPLQTSRLEASSVANTDPPVQRGRAVPGIGRTEEEEEKVAPKDEPGTALQDEERGKPVQAKLATDTDLQRQPKQDDEKGEEPLQAPPPVQRQMAEEDGEAIQTKPLPGGAIQRLCTECEGEKQQEHEKPAEMVQRRSARYQLHDDQEEEKQQVLAKGGDSATPSVTPSVAANSHSMNHGGREKGPLNFLSTVRVAVAVGTSHGPVRPPAIGVAPPAPTASQMVGLQRLAGNAAVVAFLQRQAPSPPTTTVTPTNAEAITSATKQATRAWLAQHVADVYEAEPAAGPDLWLGALKAELGVGDLQGLSAADTRRLRLLDQQLSAGLTSALAARFAAQARRPGGPAVTDAAHAALGTALPGSTQLTDQVWVNGAGNGPIAKLPRDARGAATAAWKALQGHLKSITASWVTATTATARSLPAVAVAAAMAVVQPRRSWIAPASDLTAFVDEVAARLPAADDKAAVRANGIGLLALAETRILEATMGGVDGMRSLTAAGWLAHGMDYYRSLLSEPLWVFFQQRVADISFLGHKPGKNAGMHVELEPVLRAVEASMVRHKGVPTLADVGVHKLFGLRFGFEPEQQEHARARAFDLSPSAKNPMVKQHHLTLASVLSHTWLHEINAVQPPAQRAALLGAIRPLVDEQQALRAALGTTVGTPAQRARLTQIDAQLRALYASADTASYVARSLAAKQEIERAQIVLTTTWNRLSPGADAALLARRVDAEVRAALATEQGNAALLSLFVTMLTPAPRSRPSAGLATAKAAQTVTNDRIRRLGELQRALAGRAGAALIGQTPARAPRSSNPKMDQIAASGMVNIPDWMLAAFMENGWTWGGAGWGAESGRDAMHFEYRGALSGVRT